MQNGRSVCNVRGPGRDSGVWRSSTIHGLRPLSSSSSQLGQTESEKMVGQSSVPISSYIQSPQDKGSTGKKEKDVSSANTFKVDIRPVGPIRLSNEDPDEVQSDDSGASESESETIPSDICEETEDSSEEIFSSESQIIRKENADPTEEALRKAFIQAAQAESNAGCNISKQDEGAPTKSESKTAGFLIPIDHKSKIPDSASCPFAPCCDRGRSVAMLEILERRSSHRPVCSTASGMGLPDGRHSSSTDSVSHIQHSSNVGVPTVAV